MSEDVQRATPPPPAQGGGAGRPPPAPESGGGAGRAWLRLLAVVALVVVADQASKEAVVSGLAPGERVELALGVDLARVSNSGIAFGLLGDASGGLVLAVTALSLALVLAWFATDPRRPGIWLAIGLLVGGALGNLVDRVREQAVTDFIDPPLWPAFNLADIAITAGAVALVLVALRGGSRRPESEPRGAQ